MIESTLLDAILDVHLDVPRSAVTDEILLHFLEEQRQSEALVQMKIAVTLAWSLLKSL